MALIRAAEPDDARAIAAVHVASWRATYHGLLPDDFLAGLALAPREAQWARALAAPPDERGVWVATDDTGAVLGFASGGPERGGDAAYPGELYALYLLPEAQGRGRGRRLFGAVAADLARRGFPALLLWVLDGNPACRFYAHLGGYPLRSQPFTIGGVTRTELAYGWTDLGPLLTPTSDPAAA